MNRSPDLVVEGGDLGRLVVAWRALAAGKSVVILEPERREDALPAYLLPGFDAVNLRALGLALVGCEPDFLKRFQPLPQSLVQVVSPDFRLHWWSDSQRSRQEIARISRKRPLAEWIARNLEQVFHFEESFFAPGRLAPAGFFRARIGRYIRLAAPGPLARELSDPALKDLWILTAAALSGGYDPEPVAALFHLSVAHPSRWITGPASGSLQETLLDEFRQRRGETHIGCLKLISAASGGFTVTDSRNRVFETRSLLIGNTDFEGLNERRRISRSLSTCVSLVFRTGKGVLDPAVGPRAIWFRKRSDCSESGPRVLWIGREAVSDSEEKVIVSFRRIPGYQISVSQSRLGDAFRRLLDELSPGAGESVVLERVVTEENSAWLPPDLPAIEKPQLGNGLFRMGRVMAGPFGMSIVLPQARDLSRLFELPSRKGESASSR